MPDDDRFGLRLTAGWGKVLRGLRERAGLEELEQRTMGALASSLKASGGVPDLRTIADGMQESARTGSWNASDLSRLSASPPHVPTRLAEEAAQVLAATMQSQLALVSSEKAALLLTKRLLIEFAHYAGFDRMVPKLVNQGEYKPMEFHSVVNQIMEGRQLEKLARSLLKRPTAEHLRAPNRITPRRSHDELLNTTLEDL
ncbi:hypothetical protein [Polymorphospora sp. NPDC050346]|uniref:hypothetical protein n=1 Tax=Polymorphospora sp. NPDC050346 TaxID=3155780 RepID=UPI0033DE957E